MKQTIDMVAEFHRAFGVYEPGNVLHMATNDLRRTLIYEEGVVELQQALGSGDPAAVLDALVDLQYVLDGAFLCFGFGKVKNAAVAEVHRSNMSKLGADGKPIRRADGKVLKGPNYVPPNLKQFVQGSRS